MPSTAEELAAAALRAMAARIKSQVFIYEDGFLFSCEGMDSPRTERFTGTVLMATSDEDFEIEVDTSLRQRQGIAVIKPFLSRGLHAQNAPFMSLGVSPSHPKYRAFSRIGHPGYVAMPRSLFQGLKASLHEVRAACLNLADSRRVFDQCVEAVTALLPPLKPMDSRVVRVMELLGEDHRQSLEALADTTCLSYYRLSHLFSEEMGLSLRQYVLSLKIHAACRFIGQGMNLTDTAHAAGFTDSAHLSRVWAKAFGGPPTYFLNANSFSIQPALGSTQTLPEPAESQY